MTTIDDQSLLAMQSARMSPASIAQTMGWRLARVERRLGELAEAAKRAATAFSGAGAALSAAITEARFTAPREIAPVAEKPILAGTALILRSFSVWGGGHASHGELADGRRVLIWTGDPKLSPGARPKVREADVSDFKWTVVAGADNA